MTAWDESGTYEILRKEAHRARKNAYAPYSNFKVGAALLSQDGEIFTGCNMENASYGATICGERAAFAKALSCGVREFKAIAIVGGHDEEKMTVCSPCGICRQVMCEFCRPDFLIILEDEKKQAVIHTLNELLPGSFNGKDLTH